MVKRLGAVMGAMALALLLYIPVSALARDDIISSSAVLIDADTGQVLFEKNMRETAYPASTTKIMTALLVSELCSPDETVTVSRQALDIDEWDSANMGLVEGEQLPVDSAMYGLMLPSANEAANALAEHTAGSQQVFIELMNKKARAIGAEDTRFANAHGLHEQGHYTTAYDMALITCYAARNPDFMRYFGTAHKTLPATNLQPVSRSLTNHQLMLVESSDFYDPSALGGKTGYTHESGHTMSTVARQNGRTLVCVVMKSSSRNDKFIDTEKLLRYGFEEFHRITIASDKFSSAAVPLDGGEVSFYSAGDFTALLRNDFDEKLVRINFRLPKAFKRSDLLPTSVDVVVDVPDGVTPPVTLGSHPIISDLTFGSYHIPVTPAMRTLDFSSYEVSTPQDGVKGLSFTFNRGAVSAIMIGIFLLILAVIACFHLTRRRRHEYADKL